MRSTTSSQTFLLYWLHPHIFMHLWNFKEILTSYLYHRWINTSNAPCFDWSGCFEGSQLWQEHVFLGVPSCLDVLFFFVQFLWCFTSDMPLFVNVSQEKDGMGASKETFLVRHWFHGRHGRGSTIIFPWFLKLESIRSNFSCCFKSRLHNSLVFPPQYHTYINRKCNTLILHLINDKQNMINIQKRK